MHHLEHDLLWMWMLVSFLVGVLTGALIMGGSR